MFVQTKTFSKYSNKNPWFTAKVRMLCQTKEEACRSGERILYNQAKARITLTKVIRETTLKS